MLSTGEIYYPLGNAVGFLITYSAVSDLSSAYCYPVFEHWAQFFEGRLVLTLG